MVEDIINKYVKNIDMTKRESWINFNREINTIINPEKEINDKLEYLYTKKRWRESQFWIDAARVTQCQLYVDILNKYLELCRSDIANEDIIQILENLKDPKSVPALFKQLNCVLKQDIRYGRITKVFDALEIIGTDEAFEAIRLMLKSSDEYIRSEAKEILE